MTSLTGSAVPSDCSVSYEATVSNSCPSSEWQAIEAHLRFARHSVPDRYIVIAGDTVFPSEVQLTGRSSIRQYHSAVRRTLDPFSGEKATDVSLSTTQHSVVADALVNVGATWELAIQNVQDTRHGASPFDRQSSLHRITEGYYQPYSVASCVKDTIEGEDDLRPVSFPVATLISYDPVPKHLKNTTYYINETLVIDYPATLRAPLLSLGGSESNYQTSWVELSPTYFNISALGAIVVLPKIEQRSSRGIVVCTLEAGWGSSSMNVTAFDETLGATSSLANVDPGTKVTDKAFKSDLSGRVANTFQDATDFSLDFELPIFPETTISIAKEWAQFLDPPISGLNTSVIDYLMKINIGNASTGRPDVLLNYVLSGLLTNGLARVGGDYRFQGTPKLTTGPNGKPQLDGTFWVSGKGDFFSVDPEESKDWLKLRVDSTFEGYAYNVAGAGPKLAIAFLLTYCSLAIAYTVYAGILGSSALSSPLPHQSIDISITGTSSTAWDSISEVTALAMNSRPTRNLQNTCGGISELRTFKTPVRIVVRKDESEGEGEHLELVFGDDVDAELDDDSATIKTNRAYGTVPSSMLRKRGATNHEP